MSREIDEKVVAIRFDNSRFEKNVQQSMSTLDKLKEKLDFSKAAKNAEVINDAVGRCDMSPLANATENVKMRFSALEVVAVTALANITNKAVNAGERLVKSLSIDQITSGYSKYDQKVAGVQTLVNSTGKTVEEIDGYLDRLMWFSDETSYSFNEMQSALAQMTSSGGDIDKLMPMITGIANATAFAGKGSAEFSSTIRNLAQSYQAGYLQLQDMKSLNIMGTSSKQLKETLISVAENLGKIEKGSITLENFDTSLKEKWADTEVMEKGLGKFSELSEAAYKAVRNHEFDTAAEAIEALAENYDELSVRAFQSAQEAKSFKEAIDATKDAVSSGWMSTFEIILGSYDQAKKLWTNVANSLYDIFAAGAESRNEMLEKVMLSPWERLSKRVKATGLDIGTFQNALIETGKTAGVVNDELIESAGGFEASLKSGWLTKDIILTTLDKLATGESKVAMTTEEMTAELEKFQKVVDQVWHGDFKNGQERIQALEAAGYDYAEVQALVNKTVDGHRLTLADLNLEQAKAIGLSDEQVALLKELRDEAKGTDTDLSTLIEDMSKMSGRELLHGSIARLLDSIAQIKAAVASARTEVFGDMGGTVLYKLLQGFDKLTKAFEMNDEKADKLKRTFSGLFSVIKLVTDSISAVFRPVLDLLKGKLEANNLSILDITANIGDMLKSFTDMVREKNYVTRGMDSLFSVFGKASAKVKEFKMSLPDLTKYIEPVRESLTRLWKLMTEIFTGKSAFQQATTAVNNLRAAGAALPQVLNAETLAGAKTGVEGFFQRINERTDEFKQEMKDLSKSVVDFCANFVKYLGIAWDKASGIYNGLISKATEARKYFNKNIGLGGLLTVGMTTGVLLTLNKFSDALTALSKVKFGTIGEFLNGLTQTLGTLRLTMTAYQKHLQSKTFYEVAKSIGVLVASLAVLAFLPKAELEGALWTLGLLGMGLVALASAMNYIGGDLKVSAGILSLSVAVVALSVALGKLGEGMKAMDSVNNDRIAHALVALGGILLPLGLFMKAVNSMASNPLLQVTGMKSTVKVIAAMAVSILSISGSLVAIGKTFETIGNLDLSWDKFKDKWFNYVAVLGGFSLVMGALFALGKYGKTFSGIGTGILGIIAGLALFGTALKILRKTIRETLNEKETSDESFSRMLRVIGGFALIITAFIAVSALAGKYSARAGLMLIGVAAAMTVLTGVLFVLSKVDETDLKKAKGVVVAIGVVFAAILWAARGIENVKFAVVAITACMASMILLMAGMSFMDEQKMSRLIKAGHMMAMVLVSMALVFRQSSKVSKDVNIGAILAIELGMAALGALLYFMMKLDCEHALEIGGALSMVMLAFAGALKIINGKIAPMSAKAIVSLAVMLGVVTGLAGVLWGMSALGIENALQNAAALSILMLAFSASMNLLISVGVAAELALKGAAALGIVVVALMVVMAALGGLNELTEGKISEFMDGGLKMLQDLGEGLGKALGKFVGGIFEGLTEDLMTTANNIKDFMTILGETPTVSTEILSSFISAVEKMSVISFKDKNISRCRTVMNDFVSAFKEFAVSISEVEDADKLLTGTDAFKKVAEALGELPNTAGLFREGVDFSKMGDTLSDFADGIIAFNDKIKELTPRQIEEVVNQLLNLGKIGSLDFTGITSVSNAMSQLSANGLQAFVNEFSGSIVTIKNTIVDTVQTAAQNAMTIQNRTEFETLGRYLMIGVENGIDNKKDSVFAKAQEVLDGILNVFGESREGLSDLVADQEVFQQIGENLRAFSEGFQDFSAKLDEIQNTERNLEILNTICETVAKLPDTNLKTYGKRLESFGTSLKTFCAQVWIVTDKGNGGTTEEAISLIDSFTESLTNLTMLSDSIDAFSDGLNSLTTQIQNVVRDVATDAAHIQEDTTIYKSWHSAGAYLIQGLIDGMETKAPVANMTIENIGFDLLTRFERSTEINSPSKAFKRDGGFIIAGLVKGLKDNEDDVYDTIGGVGKGVLKTFADVLGIHSPAKETIEQGINTVKGWINGAVSESGSFFAAIGDLASGGLEKFSSILGGTKLSETMSNALGDLSNLLNTDTTISDASKNLAGNMLGSFAQSVTTDTQAEDAMKQKAQAIVNAFKVGLDAADLNKTTNDLEYKLYAALNGESDSVKLDYLQKNITEQEKRVALATSEYETTKAAFGEAATETQEAYNKLLQEQITLAELNKTVTETRSSITTNQREAAKAYYQYLQECQPLIDRGEFTLEQVMKAAAERTGYNISESFSNATESAQNGAETVVQGAAAAMEQQAPVVEAAGEKLMDRFISAMESKEGSIVDLAKRVANVFASALDSSSDDLTITPVVDLSNVETGSNKLTNMLGRMRSFALDGVSKQVNSVTEAKANREASAKANSESASTVTTVTFNQTNNSPKNINATEAYRQGKTLIGMATNAANLIANKKIYA